MSPFLSGQIPKNKKQAALAKTSGALTQLKGEKIMLLLITLWLMFCSTGFSNPAAPVPKQQVRTFINLLDYIGKDYPNAVQHGTVINEVEYKEMTDFSRQISTLYNELRPAINRPGFTALNDDILELKEAIDDKAVAGKVAAIANRIREDILALRLVEVTPRRWPDLAKGKNIFQNRCQSCHGAKGFGDGPLAAQLKPSPTNFQDSTNADKLSPLQAYNTIRLGIEGTGMRSFSELSDQQAWDVAFYVNSLHYQHSVPDSTRKRIKQALADTASLHAISLYTNQQWKNLFQSKEIDPQKGMAVVRGLTSAPGNTSSKDKLAHALSLLEKSKTAYLNEDYAGARTYALDAYLEGVEPEESSIAASDPALSKRVESEMLSIRTAIKKRISSKQYEAKIESASLAIREAQDLLHNQDYSFWVNFLLAASILLREGLEAFLIIMVILSVLRSVEANRTAKYVHAGWITAVLVGIVGWFIIQSLIGMSSLQRELMEGIGALVAVAMLLYIGFWMHNKTHASQWTRFIKEKVHGVLDSGSIWGLAALSFIVVFREAFESIIFLSSISLKSAGNNAGIFLALIAVGILITGIGYIFNRVTKKIPVRLLFKYSSIMLSVLALILIGKGIRSLQEAGYVDIASLQVNWSVPLLGFYATWPTIAAQFLILTIIIGLWYYSNRLALVKD